MDDPSLPERDDAARAAKVAAILGGIFALFALALHGPRVAMSVLLGAAIAVANLVTMRAIIRALVRAPDDDGERGSIEPSATGEPTPEARDDAGAGRGGGGAAWGVFAVLKVLILFGGIGFLLTRGLVDPMALVVGYGVLPLGIVLSSLLPDLGRR